MKTVIFFIALVVIILTGSCAVRQVSGPSRPVPAGAFSVFLQPLPQEMHLVTFTIRSLALRGEGDSDIPLVLLQNIFPAEHFIGVQKKLVSAVLPPGRYHGLFMRIESATIRSAEGEIDLLVPKEPLLIEHEFTIGKDRPETLLLSLSPERIITSGAIFTPKFSLWKPERLLTNLKGFVSNSGSSSLTVFDKRKMQVIGAINPGGMPEGMALDQQQGWLYVALARENSVSVIEVSNGEILGNVRLRFGDEPSELALSPSGNVLLALNRGSNSVSIIDTASLFEKGRIRLISEPTWIFMGRNEGRAYVIQAASGTLSALDLDGQRGGVSVELEDPPIKGAVSADDGSLYLITGFSGNLLVVDSANLAITKKIFIGNGAISIKTDKTTGLVYVGKNNGEIAVVDPGALMLIDSFQLMGPAQHLAIDNEENALFAVLPRSGRLQKIDLVGKQPHGRLDLETGSHAVVVMGGR